MTTEQLKNWIKAQDPDYAGRIQLGGVDGNAERFLGVYPSPDQGPAHIAIGGPACTSYGTLSARLLLRWGNSQPQAEAKANALWSLFYGLTSADMDGAAVAYTDPGSSPVPLGRGPDGVFEYVVNLRITYKKE